MNQRPASAEPLLELRSVSKRYGEEFAVSHASLTLFEGDRLQLLGSNGSGKSTLLRLMLGVSLHDRGYIRRSDAFTGGTVGYIPQRGGLYGDLTVAENFDLRCRLYGRSSADVRTSRYVVETGLDDLWKKRFGDLSGGYQRLATLAAALITEPEYLFLDEPFAGVDADNRSIVLRQLAARQEQIRLLVLAAPAREDLEFNRPTIRVREGKLS